MALPAVVLVAGLAAQEPPARGWLGVGVQEVMECRVRSAEPDRCAKKLIVTQVVVDGPADEAGVQVGDTLLALDGERLDRGLAEAAFAGLRPGTPARLEVGRWSGRVAVRAVPAPRPTGSVAVRVAVGPGATRVVRRPTVGPVPSPETVEPGRRLLILRGDADGVYQVQLRDAEVEAAPEPGLTPLYMAREGGRYVRLDPGPQLRALQDSVFRAARLRLDSIQRTLAGDEERYAALVEGVRIEAPDGFGFDFGFRLGLGRSVAGAEFETLSPELAEFFDGADEGLLCLRVLSDTPAARLGLRPGDVVVEVAGRPVSRVDELRAALGRAAPRPIEVRWVRKGETMRGVLRGG